MVLTIKIRREHCTVSSRVKEEKVAKDDIAGCLVDHLKTLAFFFFFFKTLAYNVCKTGNYLIIVNINAMYLNLIFLVPG